MKKVFQLAVMAATVCLVAACGGKNQQNPEEDKAAQELAANGTVFEGANYTITYPKTWKETFKNDATINATNEAGDVKLDATFSDYPCKPADFEQYYKNFTNMSMHSEWQFDQPVIDGNILTFKGVYKDQAMTSFVVFIDNQAGIGGAFKYPAAKASEVEPLVKPILNSIKKK